jgi:hypothetical protein
LQLAVASFAIVSDRGACLRLRPTPGLNFRHSSQRVCCARMKKPRSLCATH